MIINLLFFFVTPFILYLFYRNTKKYGLLWIVKTFLQIGLLILFICGFFKIFFNLPPNLYIKIIFFITYLWCTVGINVNIMIPLIKLIDQKLDKH